MNFLSLSKILSISISIISPLHSSPHLQTTPFRPIPPPPTPGRASLRPTTARHRAGLPLHSRRPTSTPAPSPATGNPRPPSALHPTTTSPRADPLALHYPASNHRQPLLSIPSRRPRALQPCRRSTATPPPVSNPAISLDPDATPWPRPTLTAPPPIAPPRVAAPPRRLPRHQCLTTPSTTRSSPLGLPLCAINPNRPPPTAPPIRAPPPPGLVTFGQPLSFPPLHHTTTNRRHVLAPLHCKALQLHSAPLRAATRPSPLPLLDTLQRECSASPFSQHACMHFLSPRILRKP